MSDPTSLPSITASSSAVVGVASDLGVAFIFLLGTNGCFNLAINSSLVGSTIGLVPQILLSLVWEYQVLAVSLTQLLLLL